MDKFKERILNLEKKVVDLDTKVGSIQGTTISVHPSHYSVYDKEQGEIPLDEFDTFRFMRCGDKMRDNNSGHVFSKPAYKLINPPNFPDLSVLFCDWRNLNKSVPLSL